MISKLTHFAIYVDDIKRAEDFYSKVFGWAANSYGPSDFLQLKTDNSAEGQLIGALQDRKYAPINEKVNGFECSINVENVDHTATIVKSNGGIIVMPKTEIPHVGWIIKFQDTEGNIVCAIQYHSHIMEQINS